MTLAFAGAIAAWAVSCTDSKRDHVATSDILDQETKRKIAELNKAVIDDDIDALWQEDDRRFACYQYRGIVKAPGVRGHRWISHHCMELDPSAKFGVRTIETSKISVVSYRRALATYVTNYNLKLTERLVETYGNGILMPDSKFVQRLQSVEVGYPLDEFCKRFGRGIAGPAFESKVADWANFTMGDL